MVSFVEERKDSQSKNDRDPERLDLELLAIGKRAGLSLEEMNEFKIRDLFAYVRAYTGAEDDRSRRATQKDIDSFYA